MTLDILLPARITLIMATMVYASYQDWVSREIDDKVWVIGGGVGAALTGLDLAWSWSLVKLILTFMSIGLSTGLAFMFYYMGLYGGADAKAIAAISASLPIYYPPVRFHPFTGLASLTNGLILSLILPVSFLLYNTYRIMRGDNIFRGFEHESRWRKAAAILFGTRVNHAGRFWFPLEEEHEGVRIFKFNLFSLDLEENVREDSWATPGIPLLIFITIGLVIFLTLGDLSAYILRLIT